MIFIDTDNALGSSSGDVDDAFAIAALLRSGLPIAAIGTVAGNTSEPYAFENTQRLCRVFGSEVPLLRSPEARGYLREFRGRVAALGPLTNCVDATRASEIVIVGGNNESWGRFPPVWPHEFNLTKDRDAARRVFALDVPLTFFPLNVAKQLWVRADDLAPLPAFLREGAVRWFRHLMRVRMTRRFPIYDLAAALYAIDPDGFTIETTTARMRRSTLIDFGVCDRQSCLSAREVRVCVALDRIRLWERFLALLR